MHAETNADIQAILARYPGAGRDSLIPILQDVQESQGFLCRDSVVEIGRHLNLPVSKIYGVSTFYNQFRFQAPGRFPVLICRGTACHVKGSKFILQALERELGISAGQTTRDGLFSLEVVACIGACSLAPVIVVDGEFHAGVTPEAVPGIIAQYREEAKRDAANG